MDKALRIFVMPSIELVEFRMRAEVLHRLAPIEQKPLIDEIVPDPLLGSRDVLIRVKACGVCHSNLSMIEGEWSHLGYPGKLPIIPGHEISGVIDKVGEDVGTWTVGQRVGVQVLLDSCRTCEYCLSGRENLCGKLKSTGENTDGGFAEFIAAPGDYIYAIPDNLGFEEAAPLFCPGVTAYRAVKRAGITLGQSVAILGIGGVGSMSLQFARLSGGEVTAIDMTKDKLDFALELGAENAVLASDADKLGEFDVVMIRTPSQKAIDQAVKLVKRGGTILQAVFGNVFINFDREYTVRTSVIGPRIDMLEMLKIAGKGKIKVKWKAYKLNEANEVLLKMKKGEIVGRAVLVP